MNEVFADQFPTPEACEGFWQETLRVALTTARRILGDDEAQDAVSQASLEFIQYKQSGRTIERRKETFEASLRTFFFRTVQSRALDLYRRRRLRTAHEEQGAHEPEEPLRSGPEEEALRCSMSDPERVFVETLSPTLRRHYLFLREHGNDWEEYAHQRRLEPTIRVRDRFYNDTRRLRLEIKAAGFSQEQFRMLLRGEE